MRIGIDLSELEKTGAMLRASVSEVELALRTVNEELKFQRKCLSFLLMPK